MRVLERGTVIYFLFFNTCREIDSFLQTEALDSTLLSRKNRHGGHALRCNSGDAIYMLNSAKKSLPLSSTTIKAGKFSTSIFQMAC